MATKPLMRRLAKWHIWLGWLVGVPIAMWLASGLFMTLKPLPEVRGEHLRIEQPQLEFPAGTDVKWRASEPPLYPLPNHHPGLREVSATWDGEEVVYRLTYSDGRVQRYGSKTGVIEPVNEAKAREIVASGIVDGEAVQSVTFYEADEVPFDFRRPVPVWRVALQDGTYVYVGRDTGRIEAVRTRWWRWFDFAWGLHIMDLSEREDNSHPILIGFAALSLVGALIGCVLMFRRRKAKVKAATR